MAPESKEKCNILKINNLKNIIMKRTVLMNILILICFGIKAQNFEKKIELNDSSIINLELKSKGKHFIESWDKNYALFSVKYDINEKECTPVRINEKGDTINFIVSNERGRCKSIDTKIYLPDNNKLKISSVDGQIIIEEGSREISLKVYGGYYIIRKTSGIFVVNAEGGKIMLEELNGWIEINTEGGTVNIDNSNLEGSITTMGGTVRLKNVKGEISMNRIGGDIIVEQ